MKYVTSKVTDGALKKGEVYQLVGTRKDSHLIIAKGWKVSYPTSYFESGELNNEQYLKGRQNKGVLK